MFTMETLENNCSLLSFPFQNNNVDNIIEDMDKKKAQGKQNCPFQPSAMGAGRVYRRHVISPLKAANDVPTCCTRHGFMSTETEICFSTVARVQPFVLHAAHHFRRLKLSKNVISVREVGLRSNCFLWISMASARKQRTGSAGSACASN